MSRLSGVLVFILLSGCVGVASKQQWSQQLQKNAQTRAEILAWTSEKPWLLVADYMEFWPRHSSEDAAWVQTIQKLGAERFCAELFFTRTEWLQVQRNCTRGEFFLCHPDAQRAGRVFAQWLQAQSSEFKRLWSASPLCLSLAQDWALR